MWLRYYPYRVFLIGNYNDSNVDIYGVEYVSNDIYYIYVKKVIPIKRPHLVVIKVNIFIFATHFYIN